MKILAASLALLVVVLNSSPTQCFDLQGLENIGRLEVAERVGLQVIPLTPTVEIKHWSTGWVELTPGETRIFEHNLGGDADGYFVFCDYYKSFYGPGEEGIGINQIFYGGVLSSGSGWHGGRWQGLDERKIELYRYPNDIRVEKIRARILSIGSH